VAFQHRREGGPLAFTYMRRERDGAAVIRREREHLLLTAIVLMDEPRPVEQRDAEVWLLKRPW
jgi:hypothetical protein